MDFDVGTVRWNGSDSASQLIDQAGTLRSNNKSLRLAEVSRNLPTKISDLDSTNGPTSTPANKSGQNLTNQLLADQYSLLNDTGLPNPRLIDTNPREYLNQIQQVIDEHGLDIPLPKDISVESLKNLSAEVTLELFNKYDAFASQNLKEYKIMLATTIVDSLPIGKLPSIDPAIKKAVLDVHKGELAELKLYIEQLKQEAENAKIRNSLTGLYNQAAGEVTLGKAIEAANNTGGKLSLVAADISGLGATNRSMGRSFGDKLLIEAADIFNTVSQRNSDNVFRASDALFKVGEAPNGAVPVNSHGDEFMIILPGTDIEGAEVFIMRLNQELAARKLANPNDPVLQALGFDAGVAEWQAGETQMGFLNRSDMAMYEMKNARKALASTTPTTPTTAAVNIGLQ